MRLCHISQSRDGCGFLFCRVFSPATGYKSLFLQTHGGHQTYTAL